jgi:hypothetical protein
MVTTGATGEHAPTPPEINIPMIREREFFIMSGHNA